MATSNGVQIDSTMAEITESVAAKLIASGAFQLAKKKRTRVNWENQMAYEYIEKFYGDHPRWFRIGLGKKPGNDNGNYYNRLMRYADTIIRMPDHILIFEFKMLCKPDVVAQLLNYKDMFPDTAYFSKYRNEPIKLKVVAALTDEATKTFIEKHNIDFELYQPSFYEDWYKKAIQKISE